MIALRSIFALASCSEDSYGNKGQFNSKSQL